ncbi:MAG: hypothetical protein K9J06_14710 [Flavobacteriales bacterium]|nr:hypothetical protein [Flavobacteriales bacterium]
MLSTFIRAAAGGLCLSVLVSSCDMGTKADFEIILDPNVRGKIKVMNNSSNANSYQWQLAFCETEHGNYSIASDYGNYGTFEGDMSGFFIKENTWVEVTLEATGFSQGSLSKKVHVNNVPNQVVIGNLVVTRVNLSDELGYEWDDADGTTGNPGYETPGEFPDLLVNNSPTLHAYSASEATWDVDIRNGLPVTLVPENEVFDNLSPSSYTDYYIELVDFDGPQGSIYSAPGKRIGMLTLDLYRLTHEQNGGRDDNYPDIYKIVEDGFEADLYLHWD